MVCYTNTACNYSCCYPSYNNCYQPRCCPPKQKCCCCVTIVNESTSSIDSAVAVSDQSSCGGTTHWTLAPPAIASNSSSATAQPINCDCFKFYAGTTAGAGPGSTSTNDIANAIAIGGSYGNAKGVGNYSISWCRNGCNLTITVV